MTKEQADQIIALLCGIGIIVTFSVPIAVICCMMVAHYRAGPAPGNFTIMSTTPEGIDFTSQNGGIAIVPGQGMWVWDPNKYELKLEARK